MKTSYIFILAFTLVGCESSRQSTTLTTQQATTMAVTLANNKAATVCKHEPFVLDQPARLVAGHWVWMERQGYGYGDIEANVELAKDGSTNQVEVNLMDNRGIMSPGGYRGGGGF